MALHEEAPEAGNAYLDQQFERANQRRSACFQPDLSSPDTYTQLAEPRRERFRAMLGWPLTGPHPGILSSARISPVAEDDLGHIARIWIEMFAGLELYGRLFLPPAAGPRPLVISQHGGLGRPELTAGFSGSANYNDMTRRLLS